MKIKSVALTLAAVLTCSVSVTFAGCGEKTTEIDFPEMKEYSLTDGDGAHVADVPYDEYLQVAAFTDDLYWVSAKDFGASPDKSAKENTALLQAAIDDLNAEYVIKISTEIEDLISKRDKELKSIQEYNNKIEQQIADYKLEREKAIQEDVATRIDADYKQAEYEKRYGYVGEKADNYAERLNIAIDFYDTLDPQTAKDMVVSNPYLQTYLGYEYTNLLARYVKKAKNA